ncbi:MAG TPA: HAD family hydrolase [Thermodesulfobacteriota bacterium]|nr:HAD family hydrolase [Thermodesulfobacteriota bacterium]
MDKILFKDVEAILFDFEGTLVDCQWNLQEAVKATLYLLKTLRFPVQRLQGMKYSTLMLEALKIAQEIGQSPDRVREKIGAIYDRFDEDALTRWNLRDGSVGFLSALKTKGMRIGLVSNVGRKALEKALVKLDLHPFFDVAVSRNDVQFMKPSGEGLRLALSQLRVGQDKTLYVGDSLDDIQAAKAASVKVIIIMGKENSKADLLSADPDQLIYHFNELLASLTGVTTIPTRA